MQIEVTDETFMYQTVESDRRIRREHWCHVENDCEQMSNWDCYPEGSKKSERSMFQYRTSFFSKVPNTRILTLPFDL